MNEPLVGTIAKKNDNGVVFEGSDEWANFSKPEYRKSPFHDDVRAGDTVRYTLSQNGKFITTIEAVSGADSVTGYGSPNVTAVPMGINRERSIERQVSLKAAVEVCIAAGVSDTRNILATANTFSEWLAAVDEVGDDFE